MSQDEPLLRLIYAPAATLLRLNHGWRGALVPGFLVDFESGELVREQGNEGTLSSRQRRIERVRLAVQTTHNILLIRPLAAALQDAGLPSTLRYGLKRGIEEAFQLEESELAAEQIGMGPHAAILLYEAAQGGAGVLRRFVEEANAFAEVARSALDICHVDSAGNDLRPDCHAACYECLLSFSNQLEVLELDRHAIREIVLCLAQSRTEPHVPGVSRDQQLTGLESRIDPDSELARHFLQVVAEKATVCRTKRGSRFPRRRALRTFFISPTSACFAGSRGVATLSRQQPTGACRSSSSVGGTG